MTKSRALRLLLEIVLISVPATWLWIEWGRDWYPKLFVHLVPAILEALGFPGHRPASLPDRFVSYVPFLVLMCLTPLRARRRVVGIAVGFAAIFVSHLAFTVYLYLMQDVESLRARPFPNIFPAFILLDGFPIVVWALIAKDFLGEAAARALPALFGPRVGRDESRDGVG